MTSMNEMSDQELDDLFRKSAEEIEVPFDPEAWQRMEQKLDDGGNRNAWLRWSLLVGLLLLIGTGIYLLQQRQDSLAVDKQGSDVLKDTILASGNANAKINGTPAQEPNKKLNEFDANDTENIDSRQSNTINSKNENAENNVFPVRRQALESDATTVGLAANEKKTKPVPANRNANNKKLTSQTKTPDGNRQPAMKLAEPDETAENGARKNSSLSDENQKVVGRKKLRRFAQVDQTGKAKDNRDVGLPELVADTKDVTVTSKKLNGKKIDADQLNKESETGETSEKAQINRKKSKKADKIHTPLLSDENADAVNPFVPSANPSVMNYPVLPAEKKRIKSDQMAIGADNRTDSYTARLGLLTGKGLAPDTSAVSPLNYVFTPPDLPTSPPIQPPRGKTLRGGARIGIRLIAAPDLTTVGFRDFTKPSTSAGLLLEYNLSDRWLVSAGGMYTRKVYSARGGDYNPPDGYWTNRASVDLRTVDADCQIIDIPLNVRYNAFQRTKGNWFASAGLSSYLMKNEDYDYEYYENNQLKTRSWNVRNSGSHFFAVGNLSVGYERNVNRRFSWQVEPFVKVPLGGVGFGRVRLVSSGVFFSVRYRPLVPK